MFTGIVTELGLIVETSVTDSGHRIIVEAPDTTFGLQVGDSVALNGACLTVVAIRGTEFSVDAIEETLRRSTLGELSTGDKVDLERPTPVSGRFDGHIVQGHVDGMGVIESRIAEGEGARLRIGLPSALAHLTAEKGSIAVDGVSMTVTAVSAEDAESAWFEVSLIPYTVGRTAFGQKGLGSLVNLEIDIISKYVARILQAHK